MNERIGSGAAIFGWHGFGAAVAAYLLTALLAIGLALVGPAERAEAKQAAAESELSAQAEEKVTGNGVEYRVDSGIVTITGYSGDAATLDLSTLNIGVITAIGSNAFEGQSQLASVVLPETLQSIGAYSFQGCTTLRSIDLPENVASVGASAFRNCTALTSVVVRSRELGVSDWANGSHRGWPFENAGTGAGGISATFASTCKAVPANFFNHTEGAPKVTSVTVAPGVAEIGASAFAGCTELASASLSSGLDAIRSSAFDGCVNLPSITLPATLQAIEPYSFQGCTSLGSIDLPENVASVGASAFRNCTALASVVVRSRELGVSDWANGSHRGWPFENAGTGAGGISATFASTCKAVPANFFNHTEGAPKVTSVAVQSGVAQIGNAAFQGCSYLASVDLPNSITLIGEYAFNNCTDLAALRIPPKVPADALGLKAYVDLSLGSKVTVTTGDQYNRLKGNDSYINTMRTTVELASNSLYRAKVAAVANQVYTGKKIVPSPAVKIGSKTLRKGADYTVSYSANKSCGQATITIKGKGGYVGTKAVTFKVVPAKVTGLKLGSSYRGHLSVSWSTKKALKAGASGYRVYWKAAGKKKGSYGFVAYPSYSSFSTYGLPVKKVSVKVQAYVTVDGKNAYGPWSAAKTVKVRG